ncbi:MAG: tetratricopeptide repeat protein [Ignavibacteria bacterium]|nr:tetratricopeptide repeat protein [Ignavibacteria bacterium]
MTNDELKTKVEELEALLKTGNDHAFAETQAQQLLAEDALVNEPELHCRILLALSESLWRRGMAQDALPFSEQALTLTEQIASKKLQAKALGNIGNLHINLSDYLRALDYFGRALSLSEELGNKAGVATCLGNIGNVYYYLSDYALALEYYGKALALNEALGNQAGMARHFGCIGNVHYSLSDYARALEYMGKALELDEELGNKAGVAAWLGNIGTVHSRLSDYAHALEYLGKALALHEELGNKAGVAACLGNIGNVHKNLSDYARALEYLGRALSLAEELGDKSGVATWLGNIGIVHINLSEYPLALEYYAKALVLDEELGNKRGVAGHLGNIGATYAQQDFEGYDPAKAEEFLLRAIDLSTDIGYKAALIELHKNLSYLYEHDQRFGDAFTHYKKYIAIKDEVNVEEVKKQESLRDQQKQAAAREKEMEIERTRFQERENILNNILPEGITQRLIKGENPIADHYDSVSVLFMDIVEFTTLCTKVSAQQLVHLLNAIFSSADAVMREFGMEKIKTIGDAYMAVAGAPIVQEDHAQRAANAALKLLEVMQNLVVSFPPEYGDRSWIESIPEIEVRIGLHCGPAAAGVVGENKFLYDLWGDAVNTASRMESRGEAGKIHVSEEFVRELGMRNEELGMKDKELTGDNSQFVIINSQFIFVPRDEMEIKGKGIMKTYFLEKVSEQD